MRDDEKQLLKQAFAETNGKPGDVVGMCKLESDINGKRFWYLVDKWTNGKGWFDYGTSLSFVWLTEKGAQEIPKRLEE